MSNILAIGAHPDDIEIGVGGTLTKHYERGDNVSILVLTRGARGGEGQTRISEAKKAAALIGADLFQGNLEDTRISMGTPTIDIIEAVIEEFTPDVVYTHSEHDRHQDHRNAMNASVVACRDVSKVYGYESPSVTIDFRPAKFVGIDSCLQSKMAMIQAHASQVAIRDYLDEDLIRSTARFWGRHARKSQKYAEPFEVILDRELDDLVE